MARETHVWPYEGMLRARVLEGDTPVKVQGSVPCAMVARGGACGALGGPKLFFVSYFDKNKNLDLSVYKYLIFGPWKLRF